MKIVRHIDILLLICICALSLAAQQDQPSSIQDRPETMIQSLYTKVVARHPIGIPHGTDVEVFAPYMSKSLLNGIDSAASCGADFHRRFPDPTQKPDLGWLELGFFSGDDEEAGPTAFDIERIQIEKGGSTNVYVKLTHSEQGESPLIWHIAAKVIQENGHYKVDDIIYLKDQGRSEESRLSARLSGGCDGSRWIGFDSRQSGRKKE